MAAKAEKTIIHVAIKIQMSDGTVQHITPKRLAALEHISSDAEHTIDSLRRWLGENNRDLIRNHLSALNAGGLVRADGFGLLDTGRATNRWVITEAGKSLLSKISKLRELL